MKRILVIILFLSGLITAWPAEDYIKTKTQLYRGRVRAADSKSVTIEIPGQGTMAVPRAAIVKLQVEPPPSITSGIEAYKKGIYREAQINLAKILTQYPGLDTSWAAEGLDYYARSCLMAGDIANAEKAFNAFLSAYDDDHPLARDAEIGLAETEVARQNIDKAFPKFQEMAAEFDKQLKPSNDQFPYAAAVFLGLGKCLEAKDDFNGALNAYLKVIAVYPADNAMPETLYRAALIYERQNKPELALQHLNDLTSQFPSSPYAQKAGELKKRAEQSAASAAPESSEK